MLHAGNAALYMHTHHMRPMEEGVQLLLCSSHVLFLVLVCVCEKGKVQGEHRK